MDIPTQAELIDRIEAFCGRHGMAVTRFGREVANNPAFLSELKAGKQPRLDTLHKLRDFMIEKDADLAAGASPTEQAA